MEKYICVMCGWEYDPRQGGPAVGVKPGTPFEELPDNFRCPVCDAGKVHFIPREASSGETPAPSED
ncbi:MAG: rubredoxin [Planctomycetota bacterium]